MDSVALFDEREVETLAKMSYADTHDARPEGWDMASEWVRESYRQMARRYIARLDSMRADAAGRYFNLRKVFHLSTGAVSKNAGLPPAPVTPKGPSRLQRQKSTEPFPSRIGRIAKPV